MKTVIWWPRKTNETNRFKVKTWRGFNLAILKENNFTIIEWKIALDLEFKSNVYIYIRLLPHVKLINMTMCSSDSTDSSILDLLNTNSRAYDFKILLKGFRLPLVVDVVATTSTVMDLEFFQRILPVEDLREL